ncbi:MAG: 4-diphosphocytidyl-2C-methyl-D-erythritol synthase, partial [Solirubrobacterales bacterium]|nr:4-diphosphocytidyl-2C-methyl-D-erythritol synthase [Solirubrobacterales bacterium]
MPPVCLPRPVVATGVLLAGGAGRRIGGDKALVAVAGRPLAVWPLEALRTVCRPVVVVARSGTRLPEWDPIRPAPDVWTEPEGPQHPVAGVVHALERAAGRAVLVCAVDMPLVDADTLQVILTAASMAPEAPAVVPQAGGHLQVLCALYRPAALEGLRDFGTGDRAADLVSALGPAVVPFDDDTPFFNVNRPQDVAEAEAL